jgi:hypothetical protein
MQPSATSPKPSPHVAVILVGAALLAVVLVVVIVRSGGDDESPGEGERAHPSDPRAHFAAPAAQGATGTIRVSARRGQSIDGWGTSLVGPAEPLIATPSLSRSEVRRLDRLIFEKLDIDLLRIFGPGEPGTSTQVWSSSSPVIRFMKRVRRYGVRFAFTGGGVPPWMRAGSSPRGPLRAGAEKAYARFLARNLEVASRAGVPFKWAAIGNETDIYGAFWLAMSPRQAAAVYRQLAIQIRRRHLSTRLMLGDNQGWARTLSYARSASSSRRVRRLASIVATHPYSGNDPFNMGRLARFARARGLPVWMTEWSIGCPPCMGDDGEIRTALRFADQIISNLNFGRVRAWFTFPAFRGEDGSNGAIVAIPPNGDPSAFYATKRFPVIRQFTCAARPGARHYDALVGDRALRAVAFRRGRTTALVVTNDTSRRREIAIDMGRRRGTLRTRRTTQQQDFRRLPMRRYRGSELEVRIPALSVTTFRLTSE